MLFYVLLDFGFDEWLDWLFIGFSLLVGLLTCLCCVGLLWITVLLWVALLDWLFYADFVVGLLLVWF